MKCLTSRDPRSVAPMMLSCGTAAHHQTFVVHGLLYAMGVLAQGQAAFANEPMKEFNTAYAWKLCAPGGPISCVRFWRRQARPWPGSSPRSVHCSTPREVKGRTRLRARTGHSFGLCCKKSRVHAVRCSRGMLRPRFSSSISGCAGLFGGEPPVEH